MNVITGGPAFPQNTKYIAADGAVVAQGPQGGMTLRDYFAAKAMQGLCAIPLNELYEDATSCDCCGTIEYIAKSAFEIADAMLSERNK